MFRIVGGEGRIVIESSDVEKIQAAWTLWQMSREIDQSVPEITVERLVNGAYETFSCSPLA